MKKEIKTYARLIKIQDIKKIAMKSLDITSKTFDENFHKAPPPPKKNISDGLGAYGGGKSGRRWITPAADALVEQWYQARNPGWLYTHPDYFWEGLACSHSTSAPMVASNFVTELKYPRYDRHESYDIKNLEWKIFDWGAGVGLTTALMASNMPNSTFYYVATPCSRESAFFRELVQFLDLKNITFLSSLDEVPDDLDALVGIEIVEHFQKPMKFLQPILNKVKVGGLFAHSSYWEAETKMPTLGHFTSYDFDEAGKAHLPPLGKKNSIGRTFRNAMKSRGWEHLDWDPWAHKPRFYRKIEHWRV